MNPSSRRLRIGIAAGTLAVVIGGVAVSANGSSGSASAERGAAETALAPVERKTLTEAEALDGTLGHGDPTTVSGRKPGTLTSMPAPGTAIDRGQSLYEADGRKVPLLFGDRPAWRPLGPGVTAGEDVRQLEENLVALKFASRAALGVDTTFTDATTVALKKWQRANGLDEDGILDVGDALFLTGAVRVEQATGTIGGEAMGPILKVTPARTVIDVDLAAARRSLLAPQDKVDVELPDGTHIPGTVESVGTTAEADDSGGFGGGGDPTVKVRILPDGDTGALDSAPVSVHVTRGTAENVLAVPVNALLALAEGGYAVEVAESGKRGGATHLVAVETGMFADGFVEVTGDGLAEGQSVVVPR